jgi:hypothetical protein
VTALDCYAAAFAIIVVLFALNIFGVVRPRSGVDLGWSWIATAFFGAGLWMQPAVAVMIFYIAFVLLTALNTWIGLRRGS